MFEIEYKGANALVISTKKTTAIVDPKLSLVGLKDLVAKEAIEIATEARFATNDNAVQLLIEGPGDYELGDFSIHGVRAVRHIDTIDSEPISTVYRVEVGDVRIALLGNISPRLNEDQLEELGIIDILVLPVGGNGYTLDATSAATIVRQINPKAVIPTHYADSALKYEVPQEELGIFIKELGAPTESVVKYKVKSAANLPPVLTVIELARS